MLDIGTQVKIKSLDQLLKEKLLVKDGDIFVNNEDSFILLDNFKFFAAETTIEGVDEDDSIPYFLGNGIWAPEWLIMPIMPEPEPEPKDENNEMEVVEAVAKPNAPKVYINRFTGKPFGKLMLKLIALDEKIAEFSSTRFSRLRRHELVYIANILLDHGADDAAIDVMTVKELSTYCYEQTLNLNV